MKKRYLLKLVNVITGIYFLGLVTSCTIENQRKKPIELESNLESQTALAGPSEQDYSFNPALGYIYSESADMDLIQIRERGKLIALTGYSPTGYFVYKGVPMGFEHDLLQLLAQELHLELEIVIVKDLDEMMDMLRRGEGDLIADNLIITKERDALIDFTSPLLTTRQVLIQRKPKEW